MLPDPELATTFGGGVMVRERNGQFHPDRPVYRVLLKPLDAGDAAAAEHTWRGKVVIQGRWAPPCGGALRSALALVRREAGF